MAHLTRVLLAGIRQVPDQSNKSASSEGTSSLYNHTGSLTDARILTYPVLFCSVLFAPYPTPVLMDHLRSKSHLYHIIRVIRVVTHGPVRTPEMTPAINSNLPL